MDMTRLRTGDRIYGIAGIALFIIMFLSWYSYGSVATGIAVSGGTVHTTGTTEITLDAWDAFDFIQIVLLITVIAAVGAAALRASGSELNLPMPTSTIVTGLGGLSTLLVVYRLLDTPYDGSRKYGAFLGLIAVAAITYGGWRAMQEEGASFGDVGDQLSGGGQGPGTEAAPPPPASSPPPPPPPPAAEPPPPPPPPPPGGPSAGS
jgi:hypothetical protein